MVCRIGMRRLVTLSQGVGVPYAYNWAPASQMVAWRAAKARVRGGTGSAQIACVGDSKTFGRGSNGADYTGAKVLAYPRQMALKLTARGLTAVEQSVLGTGRGGLSNFLAADARVTVGAGWSEFGSDSAAGFMLGNNADTTAFAFTPGVTFDAIDVFFVTNSAYAQWTVDIGGSVIYTWAPSGSTRFLKQSISCTRGTNTVNLKRTGVGANAILTGIATRDTTLNQVYIHNLGSSGSQASFWNVSSNSWSPLPALSLLAADLYIINLGTNEWINGVTTATFKTNMGGIITTCQAQGSVLLAAPSFSNPGVTAQASQDAFNVACRELAVTYNCPLIDESLVIGAWSAGKYYDDTHENGTSYGLEADALTTALLAA